MGQIKALLYKQWIITKRQKVGLICELATPLFSLILIYAVIYIVRSKDFELAKDYQQPEGVLPSYVTVGYLSNPSTKSLSENYDNWNPRKILRYWANPTCLDSVNTMVNKFMPVTDYFTDNILGKTIVWPMFNYSSGMNSPTASNDLLEDDLIDVNNINEDDLEDVLSIPDASVLFNSSSATGGLAVHMQMNNLMRSAYHRNNGISKVRFRAYLNTSYYDTITVPTEGYIGTLNYFSNKFINAQLTQAQSPGPRISSAVSLTYDSTAFLGYIESGISLLSIIFFPMALSLGFPLLLYALVLEKEQKVKVLLDVNGLRYRNYWFAIYVLYFILFTMTTTLFSVLGWLFVPSTFFQKIDKVVLTLFFAVWNLSQISFGIFCSLLLSHSIYANMLGYLISILMTLAFSGISFTVFPSPSNMPWYFYLLPHSAYIRFFYSMTYDCVNGQCYDSIFALEGETRRSFWGLALTIPFYGVVSIIIAQLGLGKISKIIKKLFTVKRKAIEDGAYFHVSDNVNSTISQLDKEEIAHDVEEYKAKCDAVLPGDKEYAIVVKHLTKIYDNGKKALNDFSIKIKKDRVFGLLGPNGAGKTTLLSILTGSIERTSGVVMIEGIEILPDERSTINIGYCPQFDILWPNMTVEEHLTFFTMFKGYKPDNRSDYVSKLIRQLDLEKHRKKKPSQLSGGMRRRVSLGNAVTAEPRVIFLDEPTTGLDPVRRREFWDLIKKVGVGRAVVLTTHLMEEADVLSHEIGMMVQGELKCIGTSLTLKDRYSSGTKLQLVARSMEVKDELIKRVTAAFEQVNRGWEFDKTMNFSMKDSGNKTLKVLGLAKELMKEDLIEDWSLMNGSLEDVFMNIMEASRSHGTNPNSPARVKRT